MPSFQSSVRSAGPLEDVWKLVHDPSRYPLWWQGVETVRMRRARPGASSYTMWPDGYPDFPMDQELVEGPGRVTISCLVSDLVFVWQLRDVDGGTDITVTVDLPEREAHRLDVQRRLIEASLARLARLAASGPEPGVGGQ